VPRLFWVHGPYAIRLQNPAVTPVICLVATVLLPCYSLITPRNSQVFLGVIKE